MQAYDGSMLVIAMTFWLLKADFDFLQVEAFINISPIGCKEGKIIDSFFLNVIARKSDEFFADVKATSRELSFKSKVQHQSLGASSERNCSYCEFREHLWVFF